ncbi:sigma-70 family RNA polymerase sigma factor (plasmid) [Fervidibacter sacchari]|uniref:Transcriptional regulator with XRE-family HTH domain n=1 Tax=Candidatus Fervidibacter sacchari TaxID=1448929 RepID=A0ABT2ETL7_9BACT|nr:sigma-70 family RNA polymerase sigma factor [Candidatus Fervidibacter sacchari]MCS3921314.1 transcriptional regulator with XRE-family HTH domain [Candidatus Fervidibacter sacchari]WKU18088.1 sigma-70 family RNA polymerase sigma factor [Candidatus Fervidibacter sacchari]
MQDKLERWREILVAAKPEGWKWQPPKTLSPVEPKEPPQEVKVRLDKFIGALPDDEREILQLRFVDGFTQQEIANAIGCKPLLVALIEQRAIERLSEALEADDEIVRSWVAWWGEEKREELEALLPETLTPTTECLSIGRIYEACLRWDWTEEERKHIRSCVHCRSLFNKVSKQVWHPSSRQLWNYVTRSQLTEDERLDIRYHLEEDRCRRCTFIAEKILQPIATIVEFPVLLQPYLQEEEERIVLKALTLEDVLTWRELPRRRPPGEHGRRVFAIATPTPVALATAGFAGEEIKEVKIEEGDFRAELKREPEGWVARAEAFNVPVGSKVWFTLVTPEGDEKVKKEVKLERTFDDWYFAEAKLASPEEQLGEGYFVAVLVPPS